MALQQGALYKALRNAGADDDAAQAAAEEAANYDRQLADIRADLKLLKWMVGMATAIGLGNLWLAFNIVSRLP